MISLTIQIICSRIRNTMLYKLRWRVCTVKGRSSDSYSRKGWKWVRTRENIIPPHSHPILSLKHTFFIDRISSSPFYTCRGAWFTRKNRMEEFPWGWNTVNTTLVLKQRFCKVQYAFDILQENYPNLDKK